MNLHIPLLIISFLVAKIAFAIEPTHDIPASMLRYLNSYTVAQALYNYAADTDKRQGSVCRDKYDISIGDVVALQPIVMDNTGTYPISGIWRHSFSIKRCDKTKTYNLYMIAQGKIKPYYIGGLPGDSKLLLKDIIETLPKIYSAIYTFIPGYCDSTIFNSTVLVQEIEFIKQISDNAWQESWKIVACGQQISIDISFIQKEDGIHFDIIPINIPHAYAIHNSDIAEEETQNN